MSIKKSTIFAVAVIVIVTLFQLFAGGDNTMLINMGEETMSFSGIDEFTHELAYDDIVSVELVLDPDWESLGGQEFGPFRVGQISNEDGEEYTLFVTTYCGNVIAATLADGSQMIFNYNNTGNTEDLYEMLLKNLQ